MHLISTIPGGWNPNDEGVFYIQQEPGDIVFLSAADTELFSVNEVYKILHAENSELPSLRLANLTYFKQELTIDTYIDEVISEAKVVVLKLLGGKSYFSYLVDAIIEFAEENEITLFFHPPRELQCAWRYLSEVNQIDPLAMSVYCNSPLLLELQEH
jgi:cobaltochelatase CobN